VQRGPRTCRRAGGSTEEGGGLVRGCGGCGGGVWETLLLSGGELVQTQGAAEGGDAGQPVGDGGREEGHQ